MRQEKATLPRRPQVSAPAKPSTVRRQTDVRVETSAVIEQAITGKTWSGRAIVVAALGLAFIWSYWPVFVELAQTWSVQPDYSHGFLVVPIAIAMLWFRRATCPGVSSRLHWTALIVIAFAVAVRGTSRLFYVEAIEAWTIPIWLCGAFWLIGGWALLRWALPAIFFLGFMIPLPFRAETLLSQPLQRAATIISCWLLQTIGQVTVAEGNVVIVNGHELLVAEACSGLRIFVSIVAVAYVYALAVARPWWFKGLIFTSVLPITLFANSFRIAITGLLWTYVSGDAAHRFSHDVAGIVMIPAAAALFGCVVWYFGRLFMEVQTIDYAQLAAD
jgi:exosortase